MSVFFSIYVLFFKIYLRNHLFQNILFLLGIYFLWDKSYFIFYLIGLVIILFVSQIRYFNTFKSMILLSKLIDDQKNLLVPVFYAFTDILLINIILCYKIEFSLLFTSITVHTFIVNLIRTLFL